MPRTRSRTRQPRPVATRSKRRGPPAVTSYWDRTRWPLQSLYFLLPLLIAYQLGVVLLASGATRLPPIFAESLLSRFFDLFGVSGIHLPGLFVVVVLLAQHAVTRDPWEAEPRLYAGMAVESVLLAMPLLAFAALLSRYGDPVAGLADAFASAPPNDPVADMAWNQRIIIALGAGIYEELVFRLIAIALLHAVLHEGLRLSHKTATLGAVVLSSAAFAAYHFFGPNNAFDAARATLYAVGGAYLAAVYILRGFGVVVGAHAVYDIIVFSQH
ncbi:MAG: CPBP family intramembrane glutamic endopeptidase [Planctomycetota bacterium]